MKRVCDSMRSQGPIRNGTLEHGGSVPWKTCHRSDCGTAARILRPASNSPIAVIADSILARLSTDLLPANFYGRLFCQLPCILTFTVKNLTGGANSKALLAVKHKLEVGSAHSFTVMEMKLCQKRHHYEKLGDPLTTILAHSFSVGLIEKIPIRGTILHQASKTKSASMTIR